MVRDNRDDGGERSLNDVDAEDVRKDVGEDVREDGEEVEEVEDVKEVKEVEDVGEEEGKEVKEVEDVEDVREDVGEDVEEGDEIYIPIFSSSLFLVELFSPPRQSSRNNLCNNLYRAMTG